MNLGDVKAILRLAKSGLFSRLARGDDLRGPARRIAAAEIRLFGRRTAHALAKIRGFFPDGPPGGETPEDLLLRITANFAEEGLMMSRLARDPGWLPPMRGENREAVDERLAKGGVMLWIAPQLFSMQLAVMYGHREGWPQTRLSAWLHGPAYPSRSRLALGWINPGTLRIENRYAPRLSLPDDDPGPVIAEMVRRLEDGGVMIVSGVGTSKKALTLPLLGGWLRLAVGGAKKAMDADASILAVTFTRDPDGTFVLHFDPLRERGEALSPDDLGQRMAGRLAAAMRRDPSLWWLYRNQTFLSEDGGRTPARF